MAGNFFQTKQAARQAVEGVRRSLSSQQVSEWGGEVQRHLVALGFWATARLASSYQAEAFEVPTDALPRPGLRVCYPKVTKGTRLLTFHELADDGQWLPAAALAEIDVWVVPGVAFTRDGRRLGRGGGYYDATLAHARPDAIKVGLTFECCMVEGFPTEGHDLGVDWVITERGASRALR